MRCDPRIGAVTLLLLQACGGGGGDGTGSSSSLSATGAQRIDRAESLSVNPDATRVLYTGVTDNPTGLPANTVATQNVLLFNVATRSRILVSVNAASTSAGNDDSTAAKLSTDGRFVVFA